MLHCNRFNKYGVESYMDLYSIDILSMSRKINIDVSYCNECNKKYWLNLLPFSYTRLGIWELLSMTIPGSHSWSSSP